MKMRLPGLAVAAVVLFATLAPATAQNTGPSAPPPGPNPTASGGIQLPVPAPAPTTAAPVTPAPRGRRAAPPSASPSPSGSPAGTPAPPQFTTMDGVWEVELQTRIKTFYSHFSLKQSGDGGADLSGIWNRENKKLPLTGTFDGRLFKLTATDGTTTYTLSGYAENYSDMVGLVTDGKTQMAFTAQHRKKERAL